MTLRYATVFFRSMAKTREDAAFRSKLATNERIHEETSIETQLVAGAMNRAMPNDAILRTIEASTMLPSVEAST